MTEILIRQPTILGPDGKPISQPDHPAVVAAKEAMRMVDAGELAHARERAAAAGFRIIKQSPNIRRGNIRRAKQAELKRTLKGTGKSIAQHNAETRTTGLGNQARMKIERQKRREREESERQGTA